MFPVTEQMKVSGAILPDGGCTGVVTVEGSDDDEPISIPYTVNSTGEVNLAITDDQRNVVSETDMLERIEEKVGQLHQSQKESARLMADRFNCI